MTTGTWVGRRRRRRRRRGAPARPMHARLHLAEGERRELALAEIVLEGGDCLLDLVVRTVDGGVDHGGLVVHLDLDRLLSEDPVEPRGVDGVLLEGLPKMEGGRVRRRRRRTEDRRRRTEEEEEGRRRRRRARRTSVSRSSRSHCACMHARRSRDRTSVSRSSLRYSTVVRISPMMKSSLSAITSARRASSRVGPDAKMCPNCESAYSCTPPSAATEK